MSLRPFIFRNPTTTCWLAVIAATLMLSQCESRLEGQITRVNELRTWTDISGKEIKARLVRFRSPTVYLRDNSRRTIQIHPSQLSKDDQDYIIGVLRNQKKDEDAASFAQLATAGAARNQPSTSSGSGMTPPGSGSPPRTGRGTKLGNRPGQMLDSGRNPFLSPKGETPYLETEVSGNAGGAATPESFEPKMSGGREKFGKENSEDWPKSKVMNPNVDPFADIRPANESSSEMDSRFGSSSNVMNSSNIEAGSSTSEGYRPPTIKNKFDDTKSTTATDSSETESESGTSGQATILIALAVVGILLLIMIALLIMVLIKAKNPQPRRSYY